jgi:hypothetical protein
VPQAVIANLHPPWQPISERDAEHVLDEIQAHSPQLIALSGHDKHTMDLRRDHPPLRRPLPHPASREELRITAPAGS